MSNNKASAPELELKDCVAIEKGALRFIVHSIYTTAATGLIYLVIFVVFGLMFLGVESLPGAHLGSRATIALAGGCALLPALALGFLLAKFKFGKFFAEYWQRNIVGYTMMLWHDRENNTVTHVFYGRDRYPVQEQVYGVLYLPLGGWFRQPTYHQQVCHYWQLKMATPCNRLAENIHDSAVYLYDRFGNRLRLSPPDALEIVDRFASIAEAMGRNGRDLVETRCRLDALAGAAVEAVQEILSSSRFGHSKEGREIRIKLAREAIVALPDSDPRVRSLMETLRPGPRAKVTANQS